MRRGSYRRRDGKTAYRVVCWVHSARGKVVYLTEKKHADLDKDEMMKIALVKAAELGLSDEADGESIIFSTNSPGRQARY